MGESCRQLGTGGKEGDGGDPADAVQKTGPWAGWEGCSSPIPMAGYGKLQVTGKSPWVSRSYVWGTWPQPGPQQGSPATSIIPRSPVSGTKPCMPRSRQQGCQHPQRHSCQGQVVNSSAHLCLQSSFQSSQRPKAQQAAALQPGGPPCCPPLISAPRCHLLTPTILKNRPHHPSAKRLLLPPGDWSACFPNTKPLPKTCGNNAEGNL